MVVENLKVSILIAVFNGEATLIDSIKSITSQTYKNLEILIIDDGSDDKTSEICKSLEKEDKRIKIYMNQDNIGLTKSLNILLEKSSGTFIARHDIDDLSSPERIETQLNFLLNKKVDFVYSRAQIKKSNKLIPGVSYYLPKKIIMKFKNPFIHGTLFAKKEIIMKVGKYDERFKYSQDYKLAFDLINSGFRVKVIKKPLYNLNMENNISEKYKSQQAYYADCVRKHKVPD
jgi:glycosyltransferase EpsE